MKIIVFVILFSLITMADETTLRAIPQQSIINLPNSGAIVLKNEFRLDHPVPYWGWALMAHRVESTSNKKGLARIEEAIESDGEVSEVVDIYLNLLKALQKDSVKAALESKITESQANITTLELIVEHNDNPQSNLDCNNGFRVWLRGKNASTKVFSVDDYKSFCRGASAGWVSVRVHDSQANSDLQSEDNASNLLVELISNLK